MAMKSLDLIYFSKTKCLLFASEDRQSVVIKAQDISNVIHFSVMELETENLIPSDDLIREFTTFYELIQDVGDSFRFPVFSAESSSGIKLIGNFNLTFIYHRFPEFLFEFYKLIFEPFGLSTKIC